MDKTDEVRRLNDQLRQTGQGGRIVLTARLHHLGAEYVAEVLRAVAAFSAFTPDNDPWGEHDCAVLTVGDREVLFKIDYVDRELGSHSPDPADPTVTVRVLTVMLAEDY